MSGDLAFPTAVNAGAVALAAEFHREPDAYQDARVVLLAALPWLQEGIRKEVGLTLVAMAHRGQYDDMTGPEALAAAAKMLLGGGAV